MNPQPKPTKRPPKARRPLRSSKPLARGKGLQRSRMKRSARGTAHSRVFNDAGFWALVEKSNGCWKWIGYRQKQGYGYPWKGGRHQLAHRISWELTNGPIPGDLLVLHHCDNPPCVRPDHLYLGTHADNNRDALVRGRTRWGDNTGEKHGSAVVTEQDVIAIRAAYDAREHGISIAMRMGLKKTTVYAIIRRENWKHIPGPERRKTKHARRERFWGFMAFCHARGCELCHDIDTRMLLGGLPRCSGPLEFAHLSDLKRYDVGDVGSCLHRSTHLGIDGKEGGKATWYVEMDREGQHLIRMRLANRARRAWDALTPEQREEWDRRAAAQRRAA